MAHILFFEKPGCGGNARQRRALQAAGHVLEVRDLLSAPWTTESLLAYLKPLPVSEWFNRNAPRVKQGLVQPDGLSADVALNMLIADPLLIRRPLMQNLDTTERHVGFDTTAVDAWIGLVSPRSALPAGMEACTSRTEHCVTPALTGDPHATL